MKNINYKLAREIYGMIPWYVDQTSLPTLLSILDNKLNLSDRDKCNSVSLFDINNQTVEVVDVTRSWKIKDITNNGGQVICITNFDGPITRSGGESSYGTEEISNFMMQASLNQNVIGFLNIFDSGGGSSTAVRLMCDTINEIKKEKPVYSFIKKSAYCCSAAYGIASAGLKIYAENDMAVVGSLGTMLEFQGVKANSQDLNGVKNIRLYATKSDKKNKSFEEALNNDNYSLLIEKVLNPYNDDFINLISENRPVLLNSAFLDGEDYFSKDVIGSLIDGIISKNDAVAELISLSKKYKTKNNNPLNNSKMTKEELKSQFPGIYSEILQEGVSQGVSQEKDRTGAWLAHADADIEQVVRGVDSGKNISQKETQELIIKSNSLERLKKIEAGNGTSISTEQTPIEKGKIEEKEAAAFYTDVFKSL